MGEGCLTRIGARTKVATLYMECGCELTTHNDETKGSYLCDTHDSLLDDAQMAIQRSKLEGKTIQTVEFDDYYVSYHGCESTTGLLLTFTDETKAYIQAYEGDLSISEEKE